MLKVTVELWPGGRESGKQLLATADIGRVKNGTHAAYEIELRDEVLDDIGVARLYDYPRYSASVLDLVAGGIAAALSDGKEALPARPVLPEVTVHKSNDGVPYVRLYEIPEPIGEDVDSVEQPNSRIVGKGLEALGISAGTARRVFALQDWVENFHLPYPEKCTPEQPAAIAGEVYRQTLAFLSSSEHRT